VSPGLASFGIVLTLFDDTLQPHNMLLAYYIFSARMVFWFRAHSRFICWDKLLYLLVLLFTLSSSQHSSSPLSLSFSNAETAIAYTNY
jgi:hypothetical protein